MLLPSGGEEGCGGGDEDGPPTTATAPLDFLASFFLMLLESTPFETPPWTVTLALAEVSPFETGVDTRGVAKGSVELRVTSYTSPPVSSDTLM